MRHRRRITLTQLGPCEVLASLTNAAPPGWRRCDAQVLGQAVAASANPAVAAHLRTAGSIYNINGRRSVLGEGIPGPLGLLVE
jgi:hypothetical protein